MGPQGRYGLGSYASRSRVSVTLDTSRRDGRVTQPGNATDPPQAGPRRVAHLFAPPQIPGGPSFDAPGLRGKVWGRESLSSLRDPSGFALARVAKRVRAESLTYRGRDYLAS